MNREPHYVQAALGEWAGEAAPGNDRPRFVVASVTGYPIRQQAGHSASSHGPGTVYSVLDRAFCYAEVFRARPGGGGGTARAKEAAARVCEGLNEGKTPLFNSEGRFKGWKRERGAPVTVHGTLSGYTNARCRCDDCKAVHAAYQLDYRRKRNS